MTEFNLPVPDDAPWLNLSPEEIKELRQNKNYLAEQAKQKIRKLKAQQQSQKIVEATMEHTLRPQKGSDEDLNKVLDAVEEMQRQELAIKTFEELTKDEKIKLALEELAAIVMGGQDGEEFYNSVKFIKEVLESFK